MTRADIFAGLLLAVGFCATLWGATSFQYGTQFAPGPGFAPVWLSGIGIVLSLLVAGNALRATRGSVQTAESSPGVLDKVGLLRVAATLIGLVVMVAIVPQLGLTLSILVFLLFLTLGVQRMSFPLGIGTSVATAGFIYVVFVLFLGVPAPTGPLGF